MARCISYRLYQAISCGGLSFVVEGGTIPIPCGSGCVSWVAARGGEREGRMWIGDCAGYGVVVNWWWIGGGLVLVEGEGPEI